MDLSGLHKRGRDPNCLRSELSKELAGIAARVMSKLSERSVKIKLRHSRGSLGGMTRGSARIEARKSRLLVPRSLYTQTRPWRICDLSDYGSRETLDLIY